MRKSPHKWSLISNRLDKSDRKPGLNSVWIRLRHLQKFCVVLIQVLPISNTILEDILFCRHRNTLKVNNSRPFWEYPMDNIHSTTAPDLIFQTPLLKFLLIQMWRLEWYLKPVLRANRLGNHRKWRYTYTNYDVIFIPAMTSQRLPNRLVHKSGK